MSTTEDRKNQAPQPPWRRLAGLGLELFGAVFGFVLLGTWIDRSYDTSPRGVLICAILGIFGGLYNLIRSAMKTLEPPPEAARRPAGDRNGEARKDEVDGPAASAEDGGKGD